MRIGFVVHQFPVISETFVITQAAELVASGQDVQILATAQEAPPQIGFSHALFRDAGLGARTARAHGHARIGAAALRRHWARRGLRAWPVGLLALLDRVLPARVMAVSRLLASQAELDVIHCQFATEAPGILRHLAFGTLPDTALVVHMRGMDITSHVARHGPDVYRRVFARADLLIANCQHFARVAEGLGADPAKIVVIGSPIDTDRFAPPPARDPPGGRPIRLVAVGRLVEKKGFADAIAAVARLKAQGTDVTLSIVGDGPLRAGFTQQIAEAGLQDRVVLQGALGQNGVIAALHAADIALAPSVRAGDGDEDAPVNTLKEAMATGLPVVATRHGGIPELVIPGENGLLVPERDPDALAAAIAELIARPQDWPALGAAGRAKVIEDYDKRAVLRRQIAVYRRAIAARQANR